MRRRMGRGAHWVAEKEGAGGGRWGGDSCVICMERRAIIALLPCGHLCLCHACRDRSFARGGGEGGGDERAERGGESVAGAMSEARRMCPVCMGHVSGSIRIFCPLRE